MKLLCFSGKADRQENDKDGDGDAECLSTEWKNNGEHKRSPMQVGNVSLLKRGGGKRYEMGAGRRGTMNEIKSLVRR